MNRKQKRCLYCRRLFYVDPRCNNPKACRDPKCQRRRRNEFHKRWRDRDPEVLEDRRRATRDWFSKHRGYLRDYRDRHGDYVERNRKKQRERRRKRRVDKSTSILGYHIDNQQEYFKLVPSERGVDKSISIIVKRVDISEEFCRLPMR